MKRYLTLACVGGFLAVANTSFAASGELRAGLQGGVNLATAKVETVTGTVATDINVSTRTGAAIGVYGEYGFHEFFAIRPEVTYLQKGSKIGDVTTELDYLAIPVLLEAKFDQDNFHPFLFVGPNLGFKLNAQNSTPSATTSLNNIKSIDFAFDFGGGLEFAVDKQWAVQFNVRYSLGLTDVSDQTATVGTTTTDTNYKTRGVQFMAGISYGF